MKTSAMINVFKPWMVAICFLAALPSVYGEPGPEKPQKRHIVFLISEDPDNYEAHKTIPTFAELLKAKYSFEVTVLLGEGPRNAFVFNNLEILDKADLLVVFCRRVALSPAQLDLIRKYLAAGKPVIGLRTANHAFSLREEAKPGHTAWWEFVPEILGCENKGYGPVAPGTDVSVSQSHRSHAIVSGLPSTWHSTGNLYLVAPLVDPDAVILLNGSADGKTEPIAWTRETKDKSRVFYTSLGHPDDFKSDAFQTLLVNGILWALKKKPTRNLSRQK